MGFRTWLKNIRYFFQWLGELYQTWFVPYHTDDEELEEGESAGDARPPDRMPKPSAPPEPSEAGQAVETAAEPVETRPSLGEFMAFRGPMSKAALAAAWGGGDAEAVERELQGLLDNYVAEDVGDGRYLLLDHERRHILRTDPRMSDWLSRLQHAQLENDALDVLEQICRELPVKITVGDSLVFHLRQRKWMVWQSRKESCRVKIFGTLSRNLYDRIRKIDRRARRFRRKEPHRWDTRDWASFRWTLGADVLAIEPLILDAGREFQKHVRRRRGGKGRRSAPMSANSPS